MLRRFQFGDQEGLPGPGGASGWKACSPRQSRSFHIVLSPLAAATENLWHISGTELPQQLISLGDGKTRQKEKTRLHPSTV